MTVNLKQKFNKKYPLKNNLMSNGGGIVQIELIDKTFRKIVTPRHNPKPTSFIFKKSQSNGVQT